VKETPRVNGKALERKLRGRTATVTIVGLGYAGLPMAVELARAGYPVVGYDVDAQRVAAVQRGRSPVSNVADAELAPLRAADRLVATTDASALGLADVAVLCVPTPLTAEGEPDMRFVLAATEALAGRLHRDMLVVLQSTCGPGTTARVLAPALEAASGLRVGHDFFLVFAPERIDPGNTRYTVSNTAKLVGGVTPRSTELGCLLFQEVVAPVVALGSAEVAEMAKLVENTFRFINISFVNEVALLCDRLGVNVWEVIEAAKTKPFAFMPHYPSAGVGGHCIPVVPFYLEAAARELGLESGLIRAAYRVNRSMPLLVADKLEAALEVRAGKPLGEASVLVVGVTYKPDIADIRESAALRVMEELVARGARVGYHDPLIAELSLAGETLRSVPLTRTEVAAADVVLLLTPHGGLDYDLVVQAAALVVDTHSGLSPRAAANVVNVWVPAPLPTPVPA
jgi:nucleotide sugar dehydrogenase